MLGDSATPETSLPTRRRRLRACSDAVYSKTKKSASALSIPRVLSGQRRKELVEELTKCFADVDGRRKPGPAEEAEEILTEAIRSTRPGYRPHQ
jgi:hypothetical protein